MAQSGMLISMIILNIQVNVIGDQSINPKKGLTSVSTWEINQSTYVEQSDWSVFTLLGNCFTPTILRDNKVHVHLLDGTRHDRQV